jgi:hypothetical protein
MVVLLGNLSAESFDPNSLLYGMTKACSAPNYFSHSFSS